MERIETSWHCHVGRQAGKPPRRTRLLGALLLGLAASTAHSQSQPLSLDDQLRDQLALGDGLGCVDLLRITQADIDSAVPPTEQQAVNVELKRLAGLGQIGNELRAICGPSAVSSASSLGGALDSVQATKTVSQFKLARRRIDQRLPRRERRPTSASLMLMLAGPEREISRYASEGYGVFGEIDYEWRERDDTRFEDGYKGHVGAGSLGFDFAWDRGVAGVWGGYAKTDADFHGGSAQAFKGSEPDPAFDSLLSDPTVLSGVCGGVLPGGEFDLEGSRFGAFVSWKPSESTFLDFAATYSRLDYDYARDICVIEADGQPSRSHSTRRRGSCSTTSPPPATVASMTGTIVSTTSSREPCPVTPRSPSTACRSARVSTRMPARGASVRVRRCTTCTRRSTVTRKPAAVRSPTRSLL